MRRTAPLRLEMRSRSTSTSPFRSSLEFNGPSLPGAGLGTAWRAASVRAGKSTRTGKCRLIFREKVTLR